MPSRRDRPEWADRNLIADESGDDLANPIRRGGGDQHLIREFAGRQRAAIFVSMAER
jgi:hypothetical protein